MGSPIKLKYPLFLRDFGKNKANNEENCEFNGYPKVDIEFLDKRGEINLEPNKYYDIYAYNEDSNYINIFLIEKDNVTNHYIFNLQLPFDYELRFNRDIKFVNELPSLIDSAGNCTISIFNGVGCFTINAEEK